MLSIQALRSSGRALHNGKGRPLASLRSTRNLPSQSLRLFSGPSGRTVLSKTIYRPRALTSLHIQSPVRFASTAPNAAAANPVVETVVTPPADAWVNPLEELGTSDLASITPHIGYLRELGLDYGWGPTTLIQWLLEHVHVYSGLPWVGSFVLTTVLVRVALLKLYVGASDTAARTSTVQPLVAPIQAKLKEAQMSGNRQLQMEGLNELKGAYKSAGIQLRRMFYPILLQGPLGYGTFRFLRGMADLPVPGLDAAGYLWLTDLTIPDSFYVMPLVTSALMWYTLKRGGEMGTTATTPQSEQAMKVMRIGFPVLSGVFMLYMPGCLQLTFATTAILAYFQAAAFRSPAVRSWLRIQPLPPSSSTEKKANGPYKGTITTYEKPNEGKDEGWGSSWRNLKNKASTAVARNQASKASTSRLSKSEMAKAKKYEQQRREEIEAEKANKRRRRLGG